MGIFDQITSFATPLLKAAAQASPGIYRWSIQQKGPGGSNLGVPIAVASTSPQTTATLRGDFSSSTWVIQELGPDGRPWGSPIGISGCPGLTITLKSTRTAPGAQVPTTSLAAPSLGSIVKQVQQAVGRTRLAVQAAAQARASAPSAPQTAFYAWRPPALLQPQADDEGDDFDDDGPDDDLEDGTAATAGGRYMGRATGGRYGR